MVMRNRHDGSSPGERNNLPPPIRRRVHLPEEGLAPEEFRREPPSFDAPPRPARFRWLGDMSRLAALMLAIAVADLLFIIVCLSFLAGSPLHAPGR
jgi:hypothetical protein